jgi:hypothetical protein
MCAPLHGHAVGTSGRRMIWCFRVEDVTPSASFDEQKVEARMQKDKGKLH